ncbi:zinc finger protein 385C-like isoform X1 [Scleropages formosus]|uniref:zinc finger protein 385C-like isoform X1 n=1 Tax=Scleropages formosus TaxID=113540 RepID=UPI0010FA9C7F|nr:zinc finger protein 385C isoform X1 [Scleropages formosus]
MLGTEERGDAGGRRSGRGMKRGFSPAGPLRSSPSPERGPRSGAGHRSGTLEHRPKRERKHKTYTLCEVCNIQLNSAAQAQIHYNGKSHQKRLKQISSGKSHGCTGSPSQSSSLLAALPVSGRPVQPQLDLKHLLPFQLNGSSPLSLFPNFNAMDPVQKAVINHTFGVPQPLKKKPVISCNICHLRFNSANQAEAHYKGHKHSRKLKALEAQKNKQRRLGEVAGRQRERERDKAGAVEGVPTSVDGSLHPDPEPAKQEEVPGSSVMLTPMSEVSSPELAPLASPHVSPASQGSSASDVALEPGCVDPSSSEPDTSNEGDVDSKNSKQHLHCPVCNVTVNSVSQLEAHNSGTKHKLMLEGQTVQPRRRGKTAVSRVAGRSKRLGTKGTLGVASKAFQCDVCEIHVNSETQLKQHMNSRRHKDRLAGKPPKPKFTPHSKSQQSSVLPSVRWSTYAGGAVSAMKKVLGHYSLSSLSSQTKLALHKQLAKSLTAGFLPSPVSPAALCTVTPSPLALRHPAGAAAFIQTPLLGPTLFRPAPGPLRAPHAPIIFSPY